MRIVTERHPDALVDPKRGLLREGDSLLRVRGGGRPRGRWRSNEGFSDDDHEVLPIGDAPLSAGRLIAVVGNRDLEDGDGIEGAAPWTAPAGTTEAEGDGD